MSLACMQLQLQLSVSLYSTINALPLCLSDLGISGSETLCQVFVAMAEQCLVQVSSECQCTNLNLHGRPMKSQIKKLAYSIGGAGPITLSRAQLANPLAACNASCMCIGLPRFLGGNFPFCQNCTSCADLLQEQSAVACNTWSTASPSGGGCCVSVAPHHLPHIGAPSTRSLGAASRRPKQLPKNLLQLQLMEKLSRCPRTPTFSTKSASLRMFRHFAITQVSCNCVLAAP